MERILVRGLCSDFTEIEMRKLFKPYGEVFWLKLVTHPETERCLGWGFVDMERGAASRAIDDLNGLNFRGRVLVLQRAMILDNDHLPCRFCQYVDFCANNKGRERVDSCAIAVERRRFSGPK